MHIHTYVHAYLGYTLLILVCIYLEFRLRMYICTYVGKCIKLSNISGALNLEYLVAQCTLGLGNISILLSPYNIGRCNINITNIFTFQYHKHFHVSISHVNYEYRRILPCDAQHYTVVWCINLYQQLLLKPTNSYQYSGFHTRCYCSL